MPNYLTPGADLFVGDVRNRDLLANLLRRTDAVYHLAAYQDYLPDFSRFSDVNVVSTSLIYEIAVDEGLDLQRVVVASSQSAMGEGLYRCPRDGEQTPGMRPEARCGRASGRSRARSAAGRWRWRGPRSASPTRRTRTACRSTARRWSRSTSAAATASPRVALRYSIVQGPRQSVYNAYSGACRIFCLHYLLGGAPTLYEDGEMVRDFVNIHDVVDANLLVLEDADAVGRAFNVGGGVPYTTRQFAEIVRAHYGSGRAGTRHGRVPLRRHPPHLLGRRRPRGPRVDRTTDTGGVGRRVRRLAPGDAGSRRRCWPTADATMKSLGVVRESDG